MVENDYSASSVRVELAHVRSWMIGFIEYGLLSTFGMEIGYCDRIHNEDYSYLRQNLPKVGDAKALGLKHIH